MNRIYQGKVTNVELANSEKQASKEKKWLPFDPDPKAAREKWQKALWEHHELFQDAVNYYTLALAAMVVGVADNSAQASYYGSFDAQTIFEVDSAAISKSLRRVYVEDESRILPRRLRSDFQKLEAGPGLKI